MKKRQEFVSFLMAGALTAPALAANVNVLGGDSILTGQTGASLTQNDPTKAVFTSAGGPSAVLDWAKFNIAAGSEMNFNGASTTFFNLVDGTAGQSTINGIINGNGNVWVINPAGMAFGATAQVNVGGTFAAAAGNISNAGDLRNGTAATPTFSAFGGAVSSAAGSTFKADQVALLGKTVSAAGDFKGTSTLQIGAAGKLAVDKAGGGVITVTVSDFATDPTETSVELGDLDLGDTTYGWGGDLEVRAGNAVKVKGDVTVGGTAYLTTKNGNVSVETGKTLESVGFGGYVNIVTGMSTGGKGDIDIAGSVKADGYYGSSTLYAGYGVGGVGGVGGDVSVKGTLSADMAVDARSFQGGVTVADGAKVQVADGGVKIVAAGDVAIGGQVNNTTSYGEKISLQSNGGSVTVGATGSVASKGQLGEVQIVAGVNDGVTGNVKVDGTVKAEGAAGSVWLASGYGTGSKGSVSVGGTVKAGSLLSVDGKDGISGAGTFDASGAQVQLTAANGNVAITGKSLSKEAFVEAKGSVSMDNDENDFVTLNKASGTSVNIHEANGLEVGNVTASEGGIRVVSKEGDIVVGGTVSAMDVENGFAYITTAQRNGSVGNVTVNGTVKSGAETLLGVGYDTDGGLTGGKGGIAVGENGLVLGEYGSTYVFAAGGAGKGVDIAGEVRGYRVVIGSRDASGVVASEGAKVTAGLELNGQIAYPGTLTVQAKSGNINLDSATVVAGTATFQAAGSVSAGNVANDFSSAVTATGTDVKLADKNDIVLKDINAKRGFVQISTLNGDISVAKDGTVQSAGQLQLFATQGTIVADESSTISVGGYALLYAGGAEKSSLAGTLDVGSVDIVTGGDVELGNITARSYNLYSGDLTGDGVADPSSIGVSTLAGGSISVREGAKLTATDDSGAIYLTSAGSLSVGEKSEVLAKGANGVLQLTSNGGAGSTVTIDGTVEATVKTFVNSVGGNMTVGKTGTVRGGDIAYVGSISGGEVVIDGLVESDGTAYVSGVDDVEINGTVRGTSTVYVEADKGNVNVNGKLVADGQDSYVDIKSGKNVVFSETGSLRSEGSAAIVAKGDLIQTDAVLPYRSGRMDAVSLRPAVSSKDVLIEVGGSIGGGASNPFVANGKIWAVSFGDVSLAAGNGRSLQGGNASSAESAKDSVQYVINSARKMIDGTLTPEESLAREAMKADFDDNAILYAAGNMFLYTADQLEANSYVGAGKNLTVSAATFGDMSYLDAGGLLTINNVGWSRVPQIAYFESLDGKEPNIVNQPNDVVIFINGRLAGGNLKILNQFGANEAFMVSTPELKSTQGIFGNPIFLHSDLDVANPIEVGAIEHLLQEVPRVMLDPEFPPEADSSVESVVVPERDSIRFGVNGGEEEKEASAAEGENKVALAN